MSDQPTIKLTYFNVRGRAEPIRLLLKDNNIPYQEVAVTIEEWYQKKAELEHQNLIPFGQIPLYQESDTGINIVQSHAIMRHLARKHDLYGKTSEETIQCDIVEEAYVDAAHELVTLYWDPEFESKKQNMIGNVLPNRLAALDKYLSGNVKSGGNFWVGSNVTYVDYMMWAYLDCLRPFSSESIQKCSALWNFFQTFQQRESIKKFLETERHPTFSVPFASFGGTVQTS